MSLRSLFLMPLASPRKALLAIFVIWKSFLLLVAASSPGPGYDTSTTLIQPYQGFTHRADAVSLLRLLSTKLTRWDAIYYTKIASRGYLFEQDWAFGWGFTRLISYFASDLNYMGFRSPDFLESFVGITLAHTAHGLSVIILYSLARAVFPDAKDQKLAFIASCLHIISPAGIFLSAPYGESTFALLNFSGCLLFVWSFALDGQDTALQDLSIAAAGVLFGCATTIRSNGLLNGLLFLEEAYRVVYSSRYFITLANMRRLVATVIGGVSIAVGYLLPQFIAFQDFCWPTSAPVAASLRPWCKSMLPSIYTFVQGFYWDVGFLRYWTLSNIPLFVLAAPILGMMAASSYWAMGVKNSSIEKIEPAEQDSSLRSVLEKSKRTHRVLRSLAVPQLALTLLAITNFHVQIITRISSGYCILYFWISALLTQAKGESDMERSKLQVVGHLGRDSFGIVVRYMVIYATIQAGLYSSFLPPA